MSRDTQTADAPGGEQVLHLLLVEDNPGDARLLTEYLAEAGRPAGSVTTVGTLRAARDHLGGDAPAPDAVILDLGLPDASGLDAVRAVVEEAPELPVIVLTGRDDRELAQMALREGAEDYLLKGEVTPELLDRALRYAVERKAAARELERERRKLRLLDQHLEEVFYLWDFSTEPRTLAYCSSSYEEIWGRPVEEVERAPLTFLEGMHPDDRERVRENLEAKLRGERAIDYRVHRPDGETVWIRDRSYPIRDAGGDIRWVAGVAWDITEQKRLERDLEATAEELEVERSRLAEIFREAPAFLAVLRGPEHVFERANPTYREMIGNRDLIGRPVRDVFPELEDQPFFEILDEVYRTGEPYHADEMPIEMEREGELERRHLSFVYQPLTESGENTGILVHGVDVTGQVEARREAADQERRLAQILETVADGIMFTDAEGNFEYANPAAEEILGLEESEIADRTYRDPEWRICAPDGSDFPDEDLPVARVLETGRPVSDVEHGVQRPDGSRIVLRVNAAPMRGEDGELEGVAASIRDFTEQKEFEAQLEHRALHDYLTGLPNRLLFQDRLEQALRRSTRSGSSLAVLFLDLKRFKVINDSLGHEAGDRVLEAVADRLRSTVRAQDTVSRLGGDEFTVLLEDVTWKGDAGEVVDRVMDALDAPVGLGGNEVTVDASIGVAIHTGGDEAEGVEATDLVQRADRAMYRAKQKPGTAYALAESGGEETAVTRLERESRLREALEAGELETVYHPLYDLATGSLRGVEALARWTDPELGPVSPANFIPLAEETGLIVELGEQQLRTACRAVLESDPDLAGTEQSLRLNVNLSARQLEDPDVVERIARVLDETDFPPARLYLEVTESAVMREPGAVERLKALGVGLAVDDFGTRYSTLAQVQRLTVDELKIDRSFVDGLPDDRKDRAIVQTVVTLGNALGLEVVAEGIETVGQLEAARELGCHGGQGFYFTEPVGRPGDAPRSIGEGGAGPEQAG